MFDKADDEIATPFVGLSKEIMIWSFFVFAVPSLSTAITFFTFGATALPKEPFKPVDIVE